MGKTTEEAKRESIQLQERIESLLKTWILKDPN
jgi:hypothetical protein